MLVLGGLYVGQQERLAQGAAEAASFTPAPVEAPEVGATPDSTPTETAEPTVFMDAADIPDGPLPESGETESGHAYTLTNMGGANFHAQDGLLVADYGLAYMNLGPLPGPVQEFRVTSKWTDEGHDADQPVVMIVSDGLFHPTSGVQEYANAAAHVLVYRDRWVFQTRASDGTSTNLASFTYPEPLAFDELHELRFTWADGQAVVHMGDGQTSIVDLDVEAAQWWGPFATVEVVAASGQNPVGIASWSIATG